MKKDHATSHDRLRLNAEHLHLAYDGREVVTDLDLEIRPGAITVIVGANACGKSTTLRAMARLLKPRSGAVLLDGTDIHRYPTKKLATMLGILPQSPVAPDGLTVGDLVARGRYPHQGWLQQWSTEDEEAVNGALEATRLVDLADRPVDELSGGQRQRAWIAMALAQGTEVMLLDEPTTFLDIAHQMEVLDLLMTLNQRDGRTIAVVLHDLNQACRYADHLVAMKKGKIIAEGAPADVVTPELVRAVFEIDCDVISCPLSGMPLVVPASRVQRRYVSPHAIELDAAAHCV
jgi:iron complex transport system ATP-binding protein